MSGRNTVSFYHPEKRDAFFRARFRFTAFCGLLAIFLLGLLFLVTFSIMYRMVNDRVGGLLNNSLNAAKRGASQASVGGTCMVVYQTPGGILSENFSEYQTEKLSEMLTFTTQESGNFALDGHSYCYITDNEWGTRIISIYDTTTEGKWLSAFRKILFFGFFAGTMMVLITAWLYSYYMIKPTREALEKQRELVANASHELKTPLTVLSANLSLLSAEPESTVKENEQWLQAANAQISRMNTLVYDMLELSKLEGGNPYETRSETDVTSLVEGAALCVEAGCYEKKVALSVQTEPVLLLTSKEGVEKLIFILLDNALKYTPQGGEIRVFLKRKKRGAVLSVTNSGMGLTEEQRKRIFNRFYKTEQRQGEGAPSFGLGLSIAKEISKQLGGSIDCSSVLGESVTFTVTLNE